jgi:hypothetical protein
MNRMKDDDGKPTGQAIGLLIRVGVPIALALAAIFVLASLAVPVIEQVNRAVSTAERSFGSFSSGNLGSIAILCILIIGAIGMAKVLRKK